MNAKSKKSRGAAKPGRVIVIGAGVAGLMTTLRLAQSGVAVHLISSVPACRSHSVCANDGFNAVLEPGLEVGDSIANHVAETLQAAAGLSSPAAVRSMVEAAPALLELYGRMGVPFDRDAEGGILRAPSLGSAFARTAQAGLSTGQQLVQALDAQVRRLESLPLVDARGVNVPGERRVERLEYWDFVSLILDDAGTCVGVVAQELRTMRLRPLPADAVCLATGGYAGLFRNSTAGAHSNGAATAKAFRQGAVLANADLVQHHPFTVSGVDKQRAVSSRLIAAGARVWLAKDASDERPARDIPERERDYVLERLHPELGNRVGLQQSLAALAPDGASAQRDVYLDLTHIDRAQLSTSLRVGLNDYTRRKMGDPSSAPLKVSWAAHYCLGGLWVDCEPTDGERVTAVSPRNHATSIPGLYAVGEADYQYHGAARLEGNSLLSASFAGSLAGAAIGAYQAAATRSSRELPASIFERAEKTERETFEGFFKRDSAGPNPFEVQESLHSVMSEHCGAQPSADSLRQLQGTLDGLLEDADNAMVSDQSLYFNQSAQLARQLPDAVLLAKVVAASALRRQTTDAPRLVLARYAGDSVELVDRFEYENLGQRIQVSDAANLDSQRQASAARIGAVNSNSQARASS